ncbi:MAG: nucleoside kinase [bacterium]|nr:nucleoside kinase [bacterium]
MTQNGYDSDSFSIFNRQYQRERTLTLILLAALRRIAPDYDLIVNHHFASGLFCTPIRNIEHGVERVQVDLARLEKEVRALTTAGIAIEPVTRTRTQVFELLERERWSSTLRLLSKRNFQTIQLWRLEKTEAWFYDKVDIAIGSYEQVTLKPFANGFVALLNVPPDAPFQPSQKLFEALQMAEVWGVRARVYDLGTLQEEIEKDPVGLILTSEAMHNLYLSDIARMVAAGLPERRIILIAGPSSSGKTTFSRRLQIILRAMAIPSVPIPLDDYFVDRQFCPKDEHGKYDFEHFDCIHRTRLNADVQRLLRGEAVHLPKFDFIQGKSLVRDYPTQINQHTVLILEGIHALNPDLLTEIDTKNVLKIFVSALTNLNIDRHSRIPTSDMRLLRRLVRDHRTRGHSPNSTLSLWDSVRRGENRWIFPFQQEADVFFNSALVYEIAALKSDAERLLYSEHHTGNAFEHYERLIAMLDWVKPVHSKYIPYDSVIREFIGGSVWEV